MSKSDFSILCRPVDSHEGDLVAQLTYLFDFSNFKQGKYALTLSFASASADTQTMNPGLIYVDFGASNVYGTLATKSGFPSSQYLGTFYACQSSTTQGLYRATPRENAFVVLEKPTNNSFVVTLRTLDGELFLDSDGQELTNYALLLNFRKIED